MMNSVTASNHTELTGKKVLIVDDNPNLCSILGDYLKDFDCEVKYAYNGKQALDFAKAFSFDIIITDIRMPVMNGIEFLRRINEKNTKTVKILMSGEASLEDVVSGFKEEIDDFVVKPFINMEMVRQTIERCLLKLKLQRELKFKTELVEHYNQILGLLISNTDIGDVFSFIYHSIKKFVPVNKMELLLLDSTKKFINVKFHALDRPSSSYLDISFKLEDSAFFQKLEIEDALLIGDLSEYCNKNNDELILFSVKEGMRSLVAFPLILEGHVFGFINFFSEKIFGFNDVHKKALEGIVPKISVAYEKAFHQGRLYEENTFLRITMKKLSDKLSDQQEALIFSLAELTEKRNKETGRHLLRLKQNVYIIASSYFSLQNQIDLGFGNISKERGIDLIVKSSPLHDIGKVGIPDSILLKPDYLDEKEFEVIKKHPLIGAECLENALKRVENSDFLQVCLSIAKYHHERWDGSGYPEGLKGNDIPISARIVAIADSYDALRTKRIYKPAWNREMVSSYMNEHRGKHFDPELVDIFFEVEDKLDAIYQELKD